MTIERLAELSGMSPRGIIYIEHGRRDPGYRTLTAIAQALDVTFTVPLNLPE